MDYSSDSFGYTWFIISCKNTTASTHNIQQDNQSAGAAKKKLIIDNRVNNRIKRIISNPKLTADQKTKLLHFLIRDNTGFDYESDDAQSCLPGSEYLSMFYIVNGSSPGHNPFR